MKYLLTTISLLCFAFSLHAQTEYLVKLDLETGNIEKVKKIDGVNWFLGDATVFIPDRSSYIFCGNKDQTNYGWKLYTITTSGEIISKADMLHTTTRSLIGGLVYHEQDKKIYGLFWDSLDQKTYFGTIDPATATFDKLSAALEVKGIGYESETIDLNNKRYSFLGNDTAGVSRLYSISLENYQLVHNPVFPKNVNQQMRYDKELNKLFSFYRDSATNKLSLVNINPVTGDFQLLAALPMDPAIPIFRNGYDEKRHYYMLNGKSSKGSRLYTIDVASGKVLYDAPYPQFDSGDNLIYPRYDVASNTVYAMYWEAKTQSVNEIIPQLSFEATPNPFEERVTIKLNKAVSNLRVSLYNVTGQLVREVSAFNQRSVTIQRDGLTAGMYYAVVKVNSQQSHTVKLVAR